ncbi:MAG: NUDIX hydrolase [Planctomycetota bacterium]|nr:NUDIX hydrolase [Planctomycetota bacterium]MEC8513455.1 NUDIX hydrolase [Planctomycetota bacterium]MEE2939590.1 NUDIX hydrolase [Planctomycetota bacterium]
MESATSSEDALRLALDLTVSDPGLSAVADGHRRAIRDFLEDHGPVALTRRCSPGHLTASCLLWDAAGERVLLHHHRKLGLWLQFGGHCDGDGDVRAVALRETHEESGIEAAWATPRPVDYDVHTIPARPAKGDRPAEPEHLHLDVRYLAVAPPGAREALSEESLALAWLTPAEARSRGLDESLERMLDLGPPSRR